MKEFILYNLIQSIGKRRMHTSKIEVEALVEMPSVYENLTA